MGRAWRPAFGLAAACLMAACVALLAGSVAAFSGCKKRYSVRHHSTVLHMYGSVAAPHGRGKRLLSDLEEVKEDFCGRFQSFEDTRGRWDKWFNNNPPKLFREYRIIDKVGYDQCVEDNDELGNGPCSKAGGTCHCVASDGTYTPLLGEDESLEGECQCVRLDEGPQGTMKMRVALESADGSPDFKHPLASGVNYPVLTTSDSRAVVTDEDEAERRRKTDLIAGNTASTGSDTAPYRRPVIKKISVNESKKKNRKLNQADSQNLDLDDFDDIYGWDDEASRSLKAIPAVGDM